MQWHTEYDAVLHIINKHTGEPHPMSKKIKSKGYICFHYPNAYEEDGHIVMDATASWHQENIDYTIERLRSPELMKEWLQKNEKTNDAQRFCFPLDVANRPVGTNLNTLTNATATLREDGTLWLEVSLVQYFSFRSTRWISSIWSNLSFWYLCSRRICTTQPKLNGARKLDRMDSSFVA